MKYKITLLFIIITTFCNAQIITIPDANFKNALITSLCVDADLDGVYESDADLNNDGEIQVSEASIIQRLKVSGKSISDLTGIQSFTTLKKILCDNNLLTTVDFSSNLSMQQIDCYANSFVSLTINGLPSLTSLNVCPNNLLQNLTITNNPALTSITIIDAVSVLTSLATLNCSNNSLNTLNLTNPSQTLNNLTNLDCSHNSISSLTLNPSLQTLNASYNSFQNYTLQFHSSINTVDISHNLLTDLTVYSCNLLSTLVYTDNPLLSTLMISNTNLVNLSIANFPNLTTISCNYNPLSGGIRLNSIVTSNLPLVNTIYCTDNYLSNLDLSGVPNLNTLFCDKNNLSAINLTGLNSLSTLNCSNNHLSSLDVSNATNLYQLICSNNQITTLNLSNLSNLNTVNCSHNLLTSLSVTNDINLWDLNCSYNTIASLDASGLTNLRTFDCSHNSLTSLLTNGLINLETFVCNNNQLTAMNVSTMTSLLQLYCSNNQLQSLDLGTLPNLYYLDFSNNQVSTITVTPIASLQSLYCSNNQLTAMDVTGLNNLVYLMCNYNQLTTITLNNLPQLGILQCAHNQLTSLTVTNLPVLNGLDCSYNLLPALTLNNLPNSLNLNCNNNLLVNLNLNNVPGLYSLYCNNNQLTSLLIKISNGSFEYEVGGLGFSGNPNLAYICADPLLFPTIQTKISQYGYFNCTVNSYCTFVPAGTSYTIQGNAKYDSNVNGCDATDLLIPNMKFTVTNGSVNATMISSTAGNYSTPVSGGSTVMTPKFENPTYFNVSPSSATISFPTQASPFTQNFCVVKNGTHNDLEVTLLPIGNAVPGFDVSYKIIYKNKGTNTQSGTVNLSFDDTVLDLISSNPTVSNQQTDYLTWNFTNLAPFETREISVILNLNSPTETPAVNSGAILAYAASISGAMDETPNDNSALLRQTVVNAYDPNDKTCLEGTTVSPGMAGQYVHYIIRFENNGTANAQNIVVKDVIDTAKFDVATLIPIKGSHSFETRISNTNTVEFIFQNINLPFDNANNDGYVAFKIKTKSNLTVGDTFSNSANIYFDYNAPIVTNTYVTNISTLGIHENEANKLLIYPNPVKDILYFNTEENVTKVEVYDIAGRILSSNAAVGNKVNLSGLTTGNYILKVYTENGITNAKIIKE